MATYNNGAANVLSPTSATTIPPRTATLTSTAVTTTIDTPVVITFSDARDARALEQASLTATADIRNVTISNGATGVLAVNSGAGMRIAVEDNIVTISLPAGQAFTAAVAAITTAATWTTGFTRTAAFAISNFTPAPETPVVLPTPQAGTGLSRPVDNVGGLFRDTDADASQAPGFSGGAPKTATQVSGAGTIFRGDNVSLSTSSIGAFNGGLIDFTDSTLYLDGDYASRFAMDSAAQAGQTAPTFSWVNGKIIFAGSYSATTEVDVFFRFRANGSLVATPTFTGTSFSRQIAFNPNVATGGIVSGTNYYITSVASASTNWSSVGGPNPGAVGDAFVATGALTQTALDALGTVMVNNQTNYPGINVTVATPNADLTGASFDGWWVNVPIDIPLINVDFSRVGLRTAPNSAGLPYAIRINARSVATTNQQWFNGSDLRGVGGTGTTGGEWAGGTFTDAGFQLFGNTWGDAYEVWFVDNVFPGGTAGTPRTGSLVVNLGTGGTTLATPATAVTLQSWRPRMQRPDLSLTTDGVLKASSRANVQRCPAAVNGRLVANAARETVEIRELLSTVSSRGYFIRDDVVRLTTDASSDTLTYRDLTSVNDYIFTSYTDRISNGTYEYAIANAEVDTAGFPRDFDTKVTEIDAFVQSVAVGSVPAVSVAQTNPNGNYRQIKALQYNSDVRYDLSDIFSAYTNTGFTTPLDLTLSTTQNTRLLPVDNATPTDMEFRVGTTWTADTAAGAIDSITARSVTLNRTRISGINLTSTVNTTAAGIRSPLLVTNTGTDTAFENSTVTGTVYVDGSSATDNFLRFGLDVATQASTGTITRSGGTNTVTIVNRPSGMTLGTGVQDEPVQLSYSITRPASVRGKIVASLYVDGQVGTDPLTQVELAANPSPNAAVEGTLTLAGSYTALGLGVNARPRVVIAGENILTTVQSLGALTSAGFDNSASPYVVGIDTNVSTAMIEPTVSGGSTLPSAAFAFDNLSGALPDNLKYSTTNYGVFLQFFNTASKRASQANTNRMVAEARANTSSGGTEFATLTYDFSSGDQTALQSITSFSSDALTIGVGFALPNAGGTGTTSFLTSSQSIPSWDRSGTNQQDLDNFASAWIGALNAALQAIPNLSVWTASFTGTIGVSAQLVFTSSESFQSYSSTHAGTLQVSNGDSFNLTMAEGTFANPTGSVSSATIFANMCYSAAVDGLTDVQLPIVYNSPATFIPDSAYVTLDTGEPGVQQQIAGANFGDREAGRQVVIANGIRFNADNSAALPLVATLGTNNVANPGTVAPTTIVGPNDADQYRLTADIVGTGTVSNPQFQAGVYEYNVGDTTWEFLLATTANFQLTSLGAVDNDFIQTITTPEASAIVNQARDAIISNDDGNTATIRADIEPLY